jgi:hypothetical protein
MAFSFLMIAITEAANSGTLVPTDTIVIPITRSDTPKKVAKPTAPEINNSDPPQSPKPPNTVYNKVLCSGKGTSSSGNSSITALSW